MRLERSDRTGWKGRKGRTACKIAEEWNSSRGSKRKPLEKGKGETDPKTHHRLDGKFTNHAFDHSCHCSASHRSPSYSVDCSLHTPLPALTSHFQSWNSSPSRTSIRFPGMPTCGRTSSTIVCSIARGTINLGCNSNIASPENTSGQSSKKGIESRL